MLDKLFLMGTAVAQEAGKAAAKQPSAFESLILPLGGFMVIMYFLMIRPQQKKAKEHSAMLTGLKAGDEVVTTGGLIGRVKSVSETFVTVDIAANTSIKVVKAHVTGLTRKEQPAADKKAKKATN